MQNDLINEGVRTYKTMWTNEPLVVLRIVTCLRVNYLDLEKQQPLQVVQRSNKKKQNELDSACDSTLSMKGGVLPESYHKWQI